MLAELKLATAGTQADQSDVGDAGRDPGPTKTYRVTTLSGDRQHRARPLRAGNVTGDVRIDATAYPPGGDCAGYNGSHRFTIAAAGVTQQVLILDGSRRRLPARRRRRWRRRHHAARREPAAARNGGQRWHRPAAPREPAAAAPAARGTTGTRAAPRAAAAAAAPTGSAGTTGTGGMAGYPAITSCRTFSHAATSGCPNVYVTRSRSRRTASSSRPAATTIASRSGTSTAAR